jgi:hypothetical protein
MRAERVRRITLATAMLCALLGGARPALAYEDQATLGLGLGYAHAFALSPAPGAAVALAASLGLGQTLTARALAGYALHPGQRPLHVGLAGAELLYVIDVIELVPWLGLGADGVLRAQAGELEPQLAAHAVLGLDYLLSRELTLSLELRPYVLLTDLDGAPVYGAVIVSASWMLDTY